MEGQQGQKRAVTANDDSCYLSADNMTLTAPSMTCLGESLYDERQKEEFSDYHLVVQGETIPVHKCVLALTSPYFKTFFMSKFQDSGENSVNLSHLFSTTEHLETTLKFMYTGKITFTKQNFRIIMNAATYLLMDELCKLCCQYLDANLHPDNVFSCWELAEKYDMKSLLEKCEALVRNRFHDMLIYNESTLNLGKDSLVQIINRGLLCFTIFDKRIDFLIKWTEHQLDQRQPLLKEILDECFDKLCLEEDEIKALAGNEALKYIQNIQQEQLEDDKYQIEQQDPDATVDVVLYYQKDEPGTVRVYAYLSWQNKWVNILWYYFDRPQTFQMVKRFIGFADNSVVFELQPPKRKRSLDRPTVVLVDIQTKALRQVKGPVHTVPDFDLQRVEHRRFYAFKNELFCLLSQESGREGRDEDNHKDVDYSYHWGFYLLKDNSWLMLCNIPIDTIYHNSCFFKVHIIDRKGEVYLLVIKRGHRDSNSGADTLFRIEEKDGIYSFVKIELAKELDMGYNDVHLCTDIQYNLVISYKPCGRDEKPRHLVLDRSLNKMVELDAPKQTAGINKKVLGDKWRIHTTHKWRYVNMKDLYMIVYPQGLDARLLYHDNMYRKIMGWQERPGPPSSNLSRLLVTQITRKLLNTFTEPAERGVFDKDPPQKQGKWGRETDARGDVTSDSAGPDDSDEECDCRECRNERGDYDDGWW